MLLFLLACGGEGPPPTPKACREPEDPLSCTVRGFDAAGLPSPTDAALAAGVQGAVHIDLDVDLQGTGSVARVRYSLLDSNQVEWVFDDAVDLVTDVDEACTGTAVGARAVFIDIDDACTLTSPTDFQLTVDVERSDGQTATCTADVTVSTNSQMSWICDTR